MARRDDEEHDASDDRRAGDGTRAAAGAGLPLREGDLVLPAEEAPTELSAPLLARTGAAEAPSLADWAAATLAGHPNGLLAAELHAALPPALASLLQTPTAVARQLLRSTTRIRRVHTRRGNVYVLGDSTPCGATSKT